MKKIDCCGLGCENCKILAREAGLTSEEMNEIFPSIFKVKLIKIDWSKYKPSPEFVASIKKRLDKLKL